MYFNTFYPAGKYYAAESHDPSAPEWPPHPSRLFSALVAAAYRSSQGMTRQKKQALEWLESLDPPVLSAPEADTSNASVTYVPPGDAVGQKGAKGKEKYEHAVFRWRQPRHFPNAVILGTPSICYEWNAEPDDHIFSALKEIAGGVTHVGTSHSIAVVSLHKGKMPLAAAYEPDQKGKIFLRTPGPGRLKELDAVFLQNTGLRRPIPICEHLAAYRILKSSGLRQAIPSAEFITLKISDTMHGADTAAYLGKSVRKAVMSILGEDAPPAVHGHHHMGRHIGWLPLPDIGHAHASGRIIGIGLMLPRDLDPKHRRTILKGVDSLKKLRLPDGRMARLRVPLPDEKLPVAVSTGTWTRASCSWATATPVVLDRPPKKADPDKIRNAIAESLVFAGYPEPLQIKISHHSIFKGAPTALAVPAKKPRYHAVVTFKEPVAGPVIAGRLRYFGIGLFRPIPSGSGEGKRHEF